MNEKCLICYKDINNDGHFWKEHRIKIENYYYQYIPNKDLYTKEQIPFKSREQYLLNNFINRSNLSKYLNELSENDAKKFCLDLLIKRKEIKNLIWTPTQTELKSLIFPTILTYNRLFKEGYYQLCADNNFTNKFENPNFKHLVSNPEYNDRAHHIIIDSREQTPLRFKDFPIQVSKLEYGDYGFSNSKCSLYTYVERKNVVDFISTLSSGYERFIKEIERAYNDGAHLIILIESKLSYVLNFNYSKWLNKFVRANPDFIFHRVRELCQNYPNIQFVFVDGVDEASKLTKLILTSDGLCRKIDVQYAIDAGLINF